MIEDQIDQDYKKALLKGDKQLVSVLRGIKSVVLYYKIENNIDRKSTLSEENIINILSKELKKIDESAELYLKAGSQERVDQCIKESNVIKSYLPRQLSDDEIAKIIDQIYLEESDLSMGNLINKTKSKVAGSASGATIAALVKEKLSGNK